MWPTVKFGSYFFLNSHYLLEKGNHHLQPNVQLYRWTFADFVTK
jgi:hypothetical protein